MPLFGLDDGGLQQACFRAYNDWVSEFCSYSPKRLFGIALIGLDDVKEGIKELERCRKIGLRGALIAGLPPKINLTAAAPRTRSGRRRRNWGCRFHCTW